MKPRAWLVVTCQEAYEETESVLLGCIESLVCLLRVRLGSAEDL